MRLPDGDGADMCRRLLAADPDLRCLVLTSYADAEAMSAAVRAGASGYLLKQVRGPALVSAVRTVAAGGPLFDPEIPLPPARPRRAANGHARAGRDTHHARA